MIGMMGYRMLSNFAWSEVEFHIEGIQNEHIRNGDITLIWNDIRIAYMNALRNALRG